MSNFKNLKVEKLPDSEAFVTGEITLEFLSVCRAEALKHLNDTASLDGFRPGHIPEDVLAQKLGEMRILEETAEVALGREYANLIKETKLVPVSRPEVSITKLAPGVPLEFKIKVALEPEFDLPDYKSLVSPLKPEELKPEATDEDKFHAKQKHRLQIIDALVKATDISIPNALIASELDRMFGQFKEDVSRTGMKFDDYMKAIKKSEVEVKEEWRDKAVERVKAELIVAKIAEKEKIEPKAEELEHEAKHLLEHYPDADPLRVRIYIYSQMKNQKVLEYLETL